MFRSTTVTFKSNSTKFHFLATVTIAGADRSMLSSRREVFKFSINKKVLLRERKRHTDRGVSSTPPEVGYPLPPLARSDEGGYLRWGTPQQGYPPRPGLTWVPQMGYPLPGSGWDTPPPPGVDRQTAGQTHVKT